MKANWQHDGSTVYQLDGRERKSAPDGVNLWSATVQANNGHKVDTAAIARQMVAAPDLLAAAKRALNVLKGQGESIRPSNVLGALDAAIRKAEPTA